MSLNTREKIEKYEAKIIECDQKIKTSVQQKKEFRKIISELEQQEKYDIIKSSNVTVTELSDDLSLGKLLREAGITKDEVLKMLPDKEHKEDEKND